MKRTTTIVLALCLIALVASATGYRFSTAPQKANRTAAVQDHRGGTLNLLAKAAAGTIDPQVNYTLEYWQLFQATYDGHPLYTTTADTGPGQTKGNNVWSHGGEWHVVTVPGRAG